MKPFEYCKVTDVAQAISLLARYQDKASILAGGSDLLGMMKDGIEGPRLRMPQCLIDIKGIGGLSYIKEQKNRTRIGATTTLSEIASSELVSKKHPIIAQAASQVAVPQIRNVGTIGGNLCQRPRCWYFRRSIFKDCMRKGGKDCYAPGGENQYHAVIGGKNCYMVSPSDLGVALAAAGARVEVAGPKGTRSVPVEQFFVGPEKNVLRENILSFQEMVVAVDIPGAPPGGKSIFLKLKERKAFDFAIASVAVNVLLKNGIVSDVRIFLGGVAPYPYRAINSEKALKGKGLKEAIGAACQVVLQGADPLSNNAYKIEAARGLLEQALSNLA